MNNHSKFDYYFAFSKQAAYCEELALNLKSAIEAGELGQRQLMETMHVIENDADEVNHDIHARLLKDFVVPFDREGMRMMAEALDDAADAIDDITITAYIYGVTELLPEAPNMIDTMARATTILRTAVQELDDVAKSNEALRDCIIGVHTLETDCDMLYIDSAHALYRDSSLDAEQRMKAMKMLDAIEEAMDAIENAAEQIWSLWIESA